MPGTRDVWNPVTRTDLRRATARALAPLTALRTTDRLVTAPSPTPTPRPDRPRRRRSRRAALVAAATVVPVLAGGSVAVAQAHKTVTLDVDGRVVEISTFAGSVEGLLAAEGVEVDDRDQVSPGATEGLREGGEVVVRHARQITVVEGGEESTVWTTALTAEEALAMLEARGQDLRLVASRSAATGRADLAVRLAGPVAVTVDGGTQTVDEGAVELDALLADLDVTVGPLDRVHVDRPVDGPLVVVVQRVVAEEQVTLTEVPFETTVEKTDDLYVGQSRTSVEGVAGERATVHRVVLVDGAEESRRLLSDAVTRAPVTEVVQEGTAARPAPKPAVQESTSSSASTGGTRAVATGDVWARLAQCESGGNPTIVSSNGLYYGLYQFSLGTWRAVGGSGLPSEASPAEQTQRAQILQARSGWGQWPACAAKLGLL